MGCTQPKPKPNTGTANPLAGKETEKKSGIV